MKPPRTLPILSVILFAAAARGEIIERVIVKVNGDAVTQSEFEARQIAAVQQARVTPDQVEKYLRENNARILQEAIDDLLLVQHAGDLGIKLRPDSPYVKEVLDGIKKENNIASDDDLQKQLQKEGMTLEELKRNIERNILKRQVMQRELESKITVTEDDAKAWYEANKADYTKPPTVHLQQIVVRSDGKDPSLAVDVVGRARGGEDLAELAKAYASNKAAVADLGVLRKGDLAPEVEKIAFALPPGQVSEPIPTPEGFRILKVVEKTDGSVVPYEDARAEIQRRLTQSRSTEQVEKYLVGLREKAIIDLRVREVPLQLTGPAPAGATHLETSVEGAAATATASPSPAAAPANPDAEISTTPQARPERVAPSSAGAPAPAPTPSPTPQPPPW
jgi:parvulin-like peptidyl-prolyl isomerase